VVGLKAGKMSGRFALIIGNTEYSDSGLAQLTAPGKDAEEFARVLKDQAICGFDEVKLVLNQPEHIVRGMIDEFFDQKKSEDLLVLYFSGHGVRDELGALYLAVINTIRTRLRSTAIKSDYIREAMDQSRSRRQVLILDCCNSGAFAQGTKAATGVSIGTASAFEAGYGRIILTASDSTQFAWEGNQVIGETDNSLFTHFLVQGLEGEADIDGDGRITVDELYDFAYEKVKLVTPKQTPSKFSSKQQGEIVLRENIRPEDIKPVPLPAALLDSIENPFSEVRLGAVRQLTKLLNGKNLGLASSAREALKRIAREDDSRTVSRAALQALGTIHQAEPSDGENSEEREQLAVPNVEPEILKSNEADHEAVQEIEMEREPTATLGSTSQTYQTTETGSLRAASASNPIRWITLAWAIGGAIGGAIYYGRSAFSDEVGQAIGGLIGWAVGGFALGMSLRGTGFFRNSQGVVWLTLAWAAGGSIGWAIGEALTEASGAAVGSAIGTAIGLAVTLRMVPTLSDRWGIFWIILASAIGGAIGWLIGRGVQDAGGWPFGVYIGKTTGWALGRAIGGGISGFAIGRQILNKATREK
jgi:uncharacterized caspase-like protein